MPDWALWTVVAVLLGLLYYIARRTYKSATDSKVDGRNISGGGGMDGPSA